VNFDTDSITVCKQDETPFSEEEQEQLLSELNMLYPDLINWDSDGHFEKVIVLKAKNYILWDGKKRKIKGSALKSSTREPAVRDFLNEIIDTMINGKFEYEQIYNKYVKEALAITDPKRWASKKTIGDKILNPQRTNEQKILDALQGSEYNEGDKVHFFYRKDGSLCTVQNFDGNYDEIILVKKLFNAVKVFGTVLPVKELFVNYSLKKNQKLLEEFK
jgi:hypothetical protein